MSFKNFMAVVTICSDFGAQENKIHHHFTFPLLLRVPKVKCVFRFTAGLRAEGTDFPCSPPPVSTPSRWSVVTAGEPAWMRPCHRVPSSPESHSRRRVSSGCGPLSLLCPESPLCRPSVLHLPPPPAPAPGHHWSLSGSTALSSPERPLVGLTRPVTVSDFLHSR